MPTYVKGIRSLSALRAAEGAAKVSRASTRRTYTRTPYGGGVGATASRYYPDEPLAAIRSRLAGYTGAKTEASVPKATSSTWTPSAPAPAPVAAPAAPTPAPAPPAVETDGTDGGAIENPEVFDPTVLEELLASIEARYGLSREELMADESEIGRLYSFVMANLQRSYEQATAQQTEGSIGRGGLRSGIHLEKQAEIDRQKAEAEAQQEYDNQQALDSIRRQLAILELQEEEARIAAAQGFGDEGLEYLEARSEV